MNNLFTELENQNKQIPLAEILRPKTLEDFLGQSNVVSPNSPILNLLKTNRLFSLIFWGTPGCGKTTLARLIATKTNANFIEISAVTSGVKEIKESVESAKNALRSGTKTILFIDEIHRLNKVVEEILYPALEDYTLDIIIGKGPSARSIRLDLPKFTLIGATTKAGSLTTPLRDRFGIVERLELYEPEDLQKIVKRSAGILNVDIEDTASMEIAKRSRGTPRIANRILKRVRDYAAVLGDGKVDLNMAKIALNKLEIDDLGLDQTDRNILLTIIQKYAGGPVGIETLAATTGEEIETIEDVYEPFLMQIGFIARTPRGRIALPIAYEHLNLEYNK